MSFLLILGTPLCTKLHGVIVTFLLPFQPWPQAFVCTYVFNIFKFLHDPSPLNELVSCTDKDEPLDRMWPLVPLHIYRPVIYNFFPSLSSMNPSLLTFLLHSASPGHIGQYQSLPSEALKDDITLNYSGTFLFDFMAF